MIICIGEAVIDLFRQKSNDFPNDIYYPLPGGCCYNISIAIARLGVPAAFLGRLSKNFFGEMQIKRLKENNVKENLIIRCDQNPILAFINNDEGMLPQYAFYEEGTADRPLSVKEIPTLPAETKCLVFGSVSMSMEPIATTIEALIMSEHTAQQKKVIAFDPNIRPFMIKDRQVYISRFKKWAAACTIAKISSEDFEYIFPDAEGEKALLKMLELGTRLAIVTFGHEGAMALLKREDGKVIKATVPGIHLPKIADTVGAGDTFLGAFLAKLDLDGKLSHNAVINLNEEDLHDTLSFANKAAAIVCTRYGAEPPALSELI